MRFNNPKLNFVDMNAYIKFGKILSICSRDIELRRNYDGHNDGQPESNKAPTFQSFPDLNQYLAIRIKCL